MDRMMKLQLDSNKTSEKIRIKEIIVHFYLPLKRIGSQALKLKKST